MAESSRHAAARRARTAEQTPLLEERLGANGDQASEETLIYEPPGTSWNSDEEQAEESDKANQQVGRLRGLLIVLSLWALIFLQASNMSGLTTTQSTIAEDLDAFASASWFTSTYLIAASSTSPLAARLAQTFSPRKCVLIAAIFFSLGGIVTSQAANLKTFLFGRALTGIGGAGIMTISFILVLELTPRKRRGLFIGLLNTGFTTGVSFGAIIAGALLPVVGWRTLFWAQAPLALLAGISIFFSIPKSFTSGHNDSEGDSIIAKLSRIDYLGAAVLTSSIILFLYGLSSAEIVWVSIGMSLVLLVAFVMVELYASRDPIIPITVLKSRGALLSCLAQLGIMAARWMVLFYTPAYAIAVRGWSPASAGSILVPTNLGFAMGGILAGWLHIKRPGSFWLASLVTYALFCLSLVLLSHISTPTIPTPLYLASVFINGLCVGGALNYTLAHLLHLTPPSTHFISTSLLVTFRGFAGSFGSAIGGGLFVRVLKDGLEKGFTNHGGLKGREELVRKLLGSPAMVQGLKGIEKKVAITSYVGAIRELFGAGAILALVMILVQAGTGWRVGREVKEIVESEEEVGNGRGAEDEEWEDGMGQGV